VVGEQAMAAELNRHRQLLAQWKQATEEAKYPLQPGTQPTRKKAKWCEPE